MQSASSLLPSSLKNSLLQKNFQKVSKNTTAKKTSRVPQLTWLSSLHKKGGGQIEQRCTLDWDVYFCVKDKKKRNKISQIQKYQNIRVQTKLTLFAGIFPGEPGREACYFDNPR